MNTILAVPASRPILKAFAPAGACADQRGEANDWRLVERRLLSPPQKDAVICLVRLERADGERMDWQIGDDVELIDWLDRAETVQEALAAILPGTPHAGVGLLPGGWPIRPARVDKRPRACRLPVASCAASGVLDLLFVAGPGQDAMLDFEEAHPLLFDTVVKLRIIGAERMRIPQGPLLFIGDRGTEALACALLQERSGDDLFILIENGCRLLQSESFFPPASSRKVTIGELPSSRQTALFFRALAARRQAIASFIDRGGLFVIAGDADDFVAIVHRSLSDLLGRDIIENLQAADRVQKISRSGRRHVAA
jgi:hypothetical protein